MRQGKNGTKAFVNREGMRSRREDRVMGKKGSGFMMCRYKFSMIECNHYVYLNVLIKYDYKKKLTAS